MDEHDKCSEFERLPGLYRRWELAFILETGAAYHLEAAGTTTDGCQLLSVWRTPATGTPAPCPGEAG